MKKILIFLLAALFVVTGVMLVACNKTVTGIKIENAPSEVTRGAKIDYSKINIVVTYEDNSEETLKLTDKGVKYDPIDTSTTGSKTLAVTYGGKSTQSTILVKEGSIGADVTVSEYSDAGTGYRAYLEAKKEQSNKETEFFNRSVSYKVGIDNGFVFLPNVTVVDSNDEEIVLDREQAKTTYKLSRKTNGSFATVAEAEQSTYLSKVENNVYYFTEEAVGETFKLDVTLSDEYELLDDNMNKTVSCEFDVTEGYNVYDALGLSVLDTLDVKAFADIKNTQLAWDSKKLSEYTDVKWVIIHNNITVYPKDLPASYFWKTTDQAAVEGSKSYADVESLVPEDLKSLLPGSLKEVCRGENWEEGGDSQQRALYVNNGTSISGNYLTLTYGVYNPGEENNPAANKIAIVHDMGMNANHEAIYPESHTSFVGMTHVLDGGVEGDDGIDKDRTIENVYFIGQNPKSEGTTTPAGLMMMTSDMKRVKLVNDIGNMWFCNATLDGVGVGELSIEKCKLYDSFSQMVFSWGAVKIDIKESEMKRAGGPVLILQTITTGTARNTEMTVDAASQLESWVTGSEMWFTINMGGSASVIPKLIGVATAVDELGGHFKRVDDGKVQANLVAIVIPEPQDVMVNQRAIPGAITVGEHRYAMENSMFGTLTNLGSIGTTGTALATQTEGAATHLSVELPQAFTVLKQGLELLSQAGNSALAVAPMYQCGNVFGFSTDGKDVLSLTTPLSQLGNKDLLSSIQQLYGGCQLVLQELGKLKTAYASNEQVLQQVEALITGWTDLATQLAPVGTYTDPANFNQAWTGNNLAVWVNPGGLDTGNINTNLKHFMIMFGRDVEAA